MYRVHHFIILIGMYGIFSLSPNKGLRFYVDTHRLYPVIVSHRSPPHFFLFRSHSLILCFFVCYFFFAKFLKFLACFIFSAIIRVVLVLLTLRSQSPTQSGYDYVVMHNFIRIIHKRQKKLFPFLLPSSSPLCVYYYGTKHFVIFAIKTNGR